MQSLCHLYFLSSSSSSLIHMKIPSMEHRHEFKHLHGFPHPNPANPLQNLLPLSPTYNNSNSNTNPNPNPNPNPSSSTTHFINMQPSEFPNLCLTNTTNPNPLFFPNNSQFHHHIPLHLFSADQNNSSLSTTASNLDEERENFNRSLSIINEKKLKRVISNRESARRSRMRKKKLIEELQSQVKQIQSINHQLSEKVIRLLENNHQILQENSQLKEKISSLQIMISDILTPLRGLEDITTVHDNIIHPRDDD